MTEPKSLSPVEPGKNSNRVETEPKKPETVEEFSDRYQVDSDGDGAYFIVREIYNADQRIYQIIERYTIPDFALAVARFVVERLRPERLTVVPENELPAGADNDYAEGNNAACDEFDEKIKQLGIEPGGNG